MTNSGHSKLGASSYYRWKACPGSVVACKDIVSESSIYAEEGTLAHTIAAELLSGEVSQNKDTDQDMFDAINVYVDHVQNLRADNPSFEAVEQKLNLAEYHPELYGTADYVCYFKDTKTLHVVDYKHGAGIPVEVDNSPQLMYYGLGALHMNKFPIERIVLTIVQPRCYHHSGPIRSWETDPITMLDFASDLIDDAVATENPNAPLHSGDHCRFCPAQPTCPEAQKTALIAKTAGFTNVEEFDTERLSKALTLVPQIKAWCKAVDEFAYKQASLGYNIPGFKLVDKRSTRSWVDGFKPTMAIFDISWYDEKLKSPAQVEKLIPKDKKALLDKYIVKESSGKTLVPCTDDRAPVKGHIESMFSEIE